MFVKTCGKRNTKMLESNNCRVEHKIDDLWICSVAGTAAPCPYSVIYKSEKYCLHGNNMNFAV